MPTQQKACNSQIFLLANTCSEHKLHSLPEVNPLQDEGSITRSINAGFAHPLLTMAPLWASLVAVLCTASCRWPHPPPPDTELMHRHIETILSVQSTVQHYNQKCTIVFKLFFI